jgi:hypothetical protein
MEPVKVAVTRDMVDYALQQTSTLCAVALALRDANEDGDWILPRVDQDTIRVTDRRAGERYTWRTPRKVANYIDKFDRQREAVGPMTFVLGEPDEVRPIRHRQPSEIIADAERRKKWRETHAVNGTTLPRTKVPDTFSNTRTRILRPPTEES